MNKNVYSLVLMDDVVEAIDKAAYTAGMSRSSLINQILAEYVSYITPQRRMQNIFEEISKIIDLEDSFIIQPHASYSMMSVRSALRYKYNPTIKYSVELYSDTHNAIGELKVNFRTQNNQLILLLNSFFDLWIKLENAYISKYFKNGINYSIDDGSFIRKFRKNNDKNEYSPEELGQAIANYIQNFDSILKEYFSNLNDSSYAVKIAENMYRNFISNAIAII